MKGKTMNYLNIIHIKEANSAYAVREGRAYWFDPGTMRFFGSKVHSKVYGGRYFITSEQYIPTLYAQEYLGATPGPRKYSVRECLPSGQIETRGEHMAYDSVEQAEEVIRALLAN